MKMSQMWILNIEQRSLHLILVQTQEILQNFVELVVLNIF